MGGLVAGLVFAVTNVVGWVQHQFEAASQTPVAAVTAPPTATPAPSESPEPEADLRACGADDLTITAATDETSYDQDAEPELQLRLSFTGEDPCKVDIGTAQQEFVISHDGTRIWHSMDCYDTVAGVETARRIARFEGEDERSSSVAWPRVVSAEGCPALDDPIEPGDYELTVRLGDLESEPVEFELTT